MCINQSPVLSQGQNKKMITNIMVQIFVVILSTEYNVDTATATELTQWRSVHAVKNWFDLFQSFTVQLVFHMLCVTNTNTQLWPSCFEHLGQRRWTLNMSSCYSWWDTLSEDHSVHVNHISGFFEPGNSTGSESWRWPRTYNGCAIPRLVFCGENSRPWSEFTEFF